MDNNTEEAKPTKGTRYRVQYLDMDGGTEVECCWAADEDEARQMTADLWLDGDTSKVIAIGKSRY